MGKRAEGVHVCVLLHGGRQIGFGHQVAGVGQQGAKLGVCHKALGVAGRVAQHVGHLGYVQDKDLAACRAANKFKNQNKLMTDPSTCILDRRPGYPAREPSQIALNLAACTANSKSSANEPSTGL